ncbi:MAG: hypothetical protein GTN76_09255 [Candidatus Aenigmarchaeota archaeon]|nr:hypothetical protein [Candidatus Aenigmarchaeota archaeon]
MSLERAYALVDEFYLRIREIRQEWEQAKAKFCNSMKTEEEKDGHLEE